MKKLSLTYFGTPDFAAEFLEKMISDSELPVEVKLVVTQPDKPVGRKQVLTPSPVKLVAQKHRLPVYEGHVKNLLSTLKEPIDLALLFAYGEIIPSDLIKAFTLGFWNIHPSLLPKYRNVAPMAYPLMLGDEKTGITIIQLDEKLDHGPIIDQEEMKISFEEKRPELEKKLTDLAYITFKEQVELAVSGNLLPAVAQVDEEATYTRMMRKDDGFISVETLKKYLENKEISDEEQPLILREYLQKFPHNSRKLASSLLLYNLYRGLFPWPGIWTKIHVKGEEKRLKITRLRYENDHVVIEQVQLEGKNEVDFATFLTVYHLA